MDGMNVIVIPASVTGHPAILIKNRQQIKKSYERIIFVDDGGVEGKTMGGWTVTFQTPPYWWDPPSARHPATEPLFLSRMATPNTTIAGTQHPPMRQRFNSCQLRGTYDATEGPEVGTGCAWGSDVAK